VQIEWFTGPVGADHTSVEVLQAVQASWLMPGVLLLAAEREAQMPIAKPHHQRQCSPAFTDSVLMPLAQDQMQVLR
jgi:hypothetical protein